MGTWANRMDGLVRQIHESAKTVLDDIKRDCEQRDIEFTQKHINSFYKLLDGKYAFVGERFKEDQTRTLTREIFERSLRKPATRRSRGKAASNRAQKANSKKAGSHRIEAVRRRAIGPLKENVDIKRLLSERKIEIHQIEFESVLKGEN